MHDHEQSATFPREGATPSAERSDHGSTHLLHTGEWELRTSALLERVLVEEPTLNATCGLYSGSVGSSAQIWRCGVVK